MVFGVWWFAGRGVCAWILMTTIIQEITSNLWPSGLMIMKQNLCLVTRNIAKVVLAGFHFSTVDLQKVCTPYIYVRNSMYTTLWKLAAVFNDRWRWQPLPQGINGSYPFSIVWKFSVASSSRSDRWLSVSSPFDSSEHRQELTVFYIRLNQLLPPLTTKLIATRWNLMAFNLAISLRIASNTTEEEKCKLRISNFKYH